jgi:predicted ATP-grasp superfamily ATP-dependent carboligase
MTGMISIEGPLRILVCEYVTGGGLAGRELPPSLAREGDMMLSALVKDLAEFGGTRVVVTRDRRLPPLGVEVETHWLEPEDEPWDCWRRLLAQADAFWPIAPESEGLLEGLSRLAVEAGCRLIGCSLEAVRLAASKGATATHLAAAGIPVVEPWLPEALEDPPNGWIVKPDAGAGCEETKVFRERDHLEAWLNKIGEQGGFIVQPCLTGEAASLSLLCQDGAALLLACNRQDVVERDGELRYLGSTVGGLETRRCLYQPFAERLARAMPGLWGYVGVDLVDTPDGAVVLEVNPRLTTSYVGLRRSLGVNPAELVLALLDRELSEITPPLVRRPTEVLVEPCHA